MRHYPKNRSGVGLTNQEYIAATLDRLGFDAAVQSLRSSSRIQNLRRQVLAEETHCHICGDEVDRSLPGSHVDGPTLEHLVPVKSAGGIWHFFDRDLVRLAHRRCNCSEGDSIQRRMERERIALAMAGRWLGTTALAG